MIKWLISLKQHGASFGRCVRIFLLFCLGSADCGFASTLFVSNAGSGRVTAFDTTTGDEILVPFPITGLNQPRGLALSPDGEILYVAEHASGSGSGQISAYYTATGNSTVPNFPVSADVDSPEGIVLSPDGLILYVSNLNTDGGTAPSITAYSTSTGAEILVNYPIVLLSGSQPEGLAVSPDGTVLYVAEQSGRVAAYNTTTGAQIVVNFPITTDVSTPTGVGLSLNGGILYVTNSGSDTITAYNTTTGVEILVNYPISAALTSPFGLAVSPDGGSLYVANLASAGPITAYNASTGVQITTGFPITTAVGSFPVFLVAFDYPSPSNPVTPPSGLTGKQRKNDFGVQFERFNVLAWQASSSSIAGYYVYRDGERIATLSAEDFSYEDHDRKKGVVTYYSVTAFNGLGGESDPVSIAIR